MSGAQLMSSMCGARLLTCMASATNGGNDTLVIKPVSSIGTMSAVSSATGCRPPDFSISAKAGLPAQVNILVFFKSSGVNNGCLEKWRTQPVSPQNSTTNPAFSMRLASIGRMCSPT